MLMAAGEGTRLRPFTQVFPKPLVPVMGVPCIQFVIDELFGHGIRNFVVNSHHLAVPFEKGLKDLDWHGADFRVSDESRKLLGSGGGPRQALSVLGKGTFLLANADRLLSFDLESFSRFHDQMRRQHGVWMTLWIHKDSKSKTAYREFEFDAKTHLINRMGDLKVGSTYYAGVACAEPEAFEHLPAGEPSDFVKDLIPELIRKQKIAAFYPKKPSLRWHDIDTPQLWWQTHLSLIDELELGNCPEVWRRRIESVNVKMSPKIWSHKGSIGDPKNFSQPVYLGAKNQSYGKVGPGAVLYGALPDERRDYRLGVGLGGLWVSTET